MNVTRKIITAMTIACGLTVMTNTAPAAEREIVAYRMTNWKTMHFDDAREADQHVKTIKRLGCEVKTGDHGGHIDVAFRCPEWRKIAADTHTRAHKWENWLKDAGFQTRHQH